MQVILTEEEYEELKRKADSKPIQDYVFLQSRILEVLEGFSKGFEEMIQKYSMEYSLNPAGCTREFIQVYTEGITSKFKR